MEPTLIADYNCVTGEGPLWHPEEGRLYWTDIPTGRMFRYDPQTGQHEQFYSGDVVGGFTLQEDGALLLFMARGAVKIWRDGTLTTVIDELEGETDSRFNDVSADPAGRVFCGTMSSDSHAGRLYRLDPDGSIRAVVEGVGTSNGMGFTLDRSQMYHTDTRAHEIYLYDYDQETGEISNRRVFVHVSDDDPGRPDGMTVDAEGCVWSARWEGNCVVRYAPDGTEDRRITFPAKKITSIAFGGPDYTDMYVTSAGGDNKAENGPGAGALFHLNLGIRGLPEFRSQIAG
jgi:D-xylonolactonase